MKGWKGGAQRDHTSAETSIQPDTKGINVTGHQLLSPSHVRETESVGANFHGSKLCPKLGTSQNRELLAVEQRGGRGLRARPRVGCRGSVFILSAGLSSLICAVEMNSTPQQYPCWFQTPKRTRAFTCLCSQSVSWWGSTVSSFKSCWDVGGGGEARNFQGCSPEPSCLMVQEREAFFYLCAQQNLLYSNSLSS